MKWFTLTPLEKEWDKLERQEVMYLEKRMHKQDSKFNEFLEDKVPASLQNTLDTAFSKAFHLIFEKGTGIIEKTYDKDTLQTDYKINEFTSQVKRNRKSLKKFGKKAKLAGNINTLISGISGVGLGALGIGIPDIVLFTGFMLRSIYEIALHYGFDYEKEEEKRYILLIIEGALSYGFELQDINAEINAFNKCHLFHNETLTLEQCIQKTASCLSKELLYMKFIQGIPVVGIAGGVYDYIYMKKVVKYAELKYRRRFYLQQMK